MLQPQPSAWNALPSQLRSSVVDSLELGWKPIYSHRPIRTSLRTFVEERTVLHLHLLFYIQNVFLWHEYRLHARSRYSLIALMITLCSKLLHYRAYTVLHFISVTIFRLLESVIGPHPRIDDKHQDHFLHLDTSMDTVTCWRSNVSTVTTTTTIFICHNKIRMTTECKIYTSLKSLRKSSKEENKQ